MNNHYHSYQFSTERFRSKARKTLSWCCVLCISTLWFCSTSTAAPSKKKNSPPAPAKKEQASPPPSTESTKKNSVNPEFDLSKEPTHISAQSLTVLTDARTFTYAGAVSVTQGDLTLTADFLDGNYSEKNEIEMIIARSNVHITKGPEIKASGQRATYDAKKRVIVLTESPQVEQTGSILTADTIRIYVDENRSVAEGNVKVTLVNSGSGLPQ